MIVVTLSNWRRKIKICIILLLLLLAVAAMGSYLLGLIGNVEDSSNVDKDRSPADSLKVEERITE